MSDRYVSAGRLIVAGRPVLVSIITNPVIDDVVIAEARITASEIENGAEDGDRRVDRSVRDFLIRLGVER